jgi:hypothetical protein
MIPFEGLELRRDNFRWADLVQDLKEREEVLISAIIIAQVGINSWSELLTSICPSYPVEDKSRTLSLPLDGLTGM